MTSFRTLPLPAMMDTSSHDLAGAFFTPLLARAARYDRGVGFFSSSWLRINAQGMAAFAAHGGRARWVTSPILDPADWEALLLGDAARDDVVIRVALERSIANLADTLDRATRSALAWMVADDILTFKLALPRNKLERGDFHDKFGVFTDATGDQVSFNGSYNDSLQGMRNYESIKIFRSWESAFAPLVKADDERFDRLWNNQDPNVRAFDLPAAVREQIVRLREDTRPYSEPEWVALKRIQDERLSYRAPRPTLPPTVTLRDYQIDAIDAWFAHGCCGLMEMATGTGKTITSLAASARLYEREGQLAVIIAVPYQHLVDQWAEEARSFGYEPILAYQSKARWLDPLNQQIMEYNGGYRRCISVIVTHSTFAREDFQRTIYRLQGTSLLIADEAHHLGAEQQRQSYPDHVPFRLALSATPDRWFDDAGTLALRDYFGETVFSFTLEQAIGVSLTNYYYYPHRVELTDEEMERYADLSAKIARLAHRDDTDAQEALRMLLIKRADLLNNAENKLTELAQLITNPDDVAHALFYCAPGQIDAALRLLGIEKGIRVHRFTAEEVPRTRQRLLAEFSSGQLQGLVAMKCLDEGVDVPTTQSAYFLASSGNPREFIQRRGRVLRRAPGKQFAILHDLVAIPNPTFSDQAGTSFDMERSIMRHEFQRIKEFANPALNKHLALDAVWDMARLYGIIDF
ncbi:DEAD/DEAH box helicase family protein [Chloroflexales bacterium ZM16-3]|nr:DEAD/DEAH box helicase family protein [Chloroflexales bacterium ZM16-3]